MKDKKEFRGLGLILLGLLLIFLPQPVFSLSTAIALPLAIAALFVVAWGLSLLKDFFLDFAREK